MSLSEFDLIDRYLKPLCRPLEGLQLGIGDDCALVSTPPGQELALSLDTLVEGVHFPAAMAPATLARRAFHAALSDLAAMGARPRWLTLGLTLARAEEAWIRDFAEALGEELEGAEMSLIGGDTTRGPLCLSLQVHGLVPAGQALRRRGGRLGDGLFVTGTLGDAMAGLDQYDRPQPVAELRQRFERPRARVAAGLALRPLAHAAIDISDGLLGDLGQMLEGSDLGAELELERLPLSPALRAHYTLSQARRYALEGGEDFELCLAAPPAKEAALKAALVPCGLALTRVGTLVAGGGLWQRDAKGERRPLNVSGYQHF